MSMTDYQFTMFDERIRQIERNIRDLYVRMNAYCKVVDQPPQPTPQPTLIEAVRDLYYSAHWIPDRDVNAKRLWENVRDAAGFDRGNAPQPTTNTPNPPTLIEAVEKCFEYLNRPSTSVTATEGYQLQVDVQRALAREKRIAEAREKVIGSLVACREIVPSYLKDALKHYYEVCNEAK